MNGYNVIPFHNHPLVGRRVRCNESSYEVLAVYARTFTTDRQSDLRVYLHVVCTSGEDVGRLRGLNCDDPDLRVMLEAT